jgi:hypothetical protein
LVHIGAISLERWNLVSFGIGNALHAGWISCADIVFIRDKNHSESCVFAEKPFSSNRIDLSLIHRVIKRIETFFAAISPNVLWGVDQVLMQIFANTCDTESF